MSDTQAGPSRRRRGSDDDRMRRSEVFTSVDPREKHKIASKYTALQGNVDSELLPSSPLPVPSLPHRLSHMCSDDSHAEQH